MRPLPHAPEVIAIRRIIQEAVIEVVVIIELESSVKSSVGSLLEMYRSKVWSDSLQCPKFQFDFLG